MLDKLISITNQLLDLGKRNRLLNYKDTGLKALRCLNKNIEEVFRGIKNGREFTFYNTDAIVNQYLKETNSEENNLTYKDIYSLAYKNLESKDILSYKIGYTLQQTLKSLYKDFKSSIIEKGINSLYISFGFIHYTEEETEFIAPLLLIPIELDNEGGIYTIKQYEDDIILNPTLKYYFNSLYHFELCDYNEEALSTYLTKIQEILPENITLEESMAIGIYSFYKMNMYNDLILHQDLVIQNKNIRLLLGEVATLENGNTTTNQPIYPVVNCDSSQLEAIQEAANGKSFCIQGPPGTGKSQTITNIISSMLGKGKKILFVSEKIAALKVVYENLRRAKLSDFAIELHSNKANKKEFIANLYSAAIQPKYEVKFKTRFLGAKYEQLKSNLRNYETSLHSMISGQEVSLLDLYSMFLSVEIEPIDIPLNVEDWDLFVMNRTIELLEEYTRYSDTIGYDYRENALYGIKNISEDYMIYHFEEDIENAIRHVDYFYSIAEIIQNPTGRKIECLKDVYPTYDLAKKIVKLKTFHPNYFNKKLRNRVMDLMDQYFLVRKELNSPLLQIYKPEILNEDLNRLLEGYTQYHKGLFKNKEYTSYNDIILKLRKEKEKPAVIIAELNEWIKIKKSLLSAKEYSDMINKIIGDFKDSTSKSIYLDLKSLDSTEDITITKEQFQELQDNFRETYTPEQMKKDANSLTALAKIFDDNTINVFTIPLSYLHHRLQEIEKEKDHIGIYRKLLTTLSGLQRYKAMDYLYAYIERKADLEFLAIQYKKIYLKQMIDSIVNQNPLLNEFSSTGEDGIISDFRELDEKLLNMNRDFIISENSQKRPSKETIIEGSKFKILAREYEKQRRQLPIRSLLDQIFELALDIKPVFLMSPLSVSTYLASKLNLFDCVIFDEASQIFASDALGSIYRAKQCIIIGDTKQMPPTNFFQAGVDEEEKEYDLESILDKASSVFETISLKWHYRSRSEELISFSNSSFYNSNLITIPQAKNHSEGFGIDFYYTPEGRYDTNTRTNPIEAARVCDMVFDHFDKSKESLGVVAFSNVQAELIAGLIEKRLKKNPEYEKFFDESLDEPFFVKNLESVQGDERDRIIFSICYGYNQENKFYQRFGPLNNLGGERRLNVAITRAKYNVSIVSSIRYEDIRSNTESLGVLLLRAYLEFAENVVRNKNFSESDNGIIRSVKQYIESLGYTVLSNYGLSSFKIDMAVKKNDEFILAIMIDNKNKYSANLTDKYRLEKLLLERLGWRYFRLFSTAWFHNIETEKQRLKNALENVAVIEKPKEEEEDSYLKVDKSMDSMEAYFDTYLGIGIERGKEFYNRRGLDFLIREIIQMEAPIHEEYFWQKLANILDKKNTLSFREEMMKQIPRDIIKSGSYFYKEKVGDFKLRISSDREISWIHPDEIRHGLYTIVQKNNGISVDGCYRVLVQLLGMEKVTASSKKILDEAMESLKRGNVIAIRNEGLFLVK